MKHIKTIILLILLLSACSHSIPQTSSIPTSQIPSVGVESTTATTSLTPALDASDNELLSAEQKQRLYQASLTYIAPTEDEAIEVARSMQFVQGDGHPSNMCGPLAIAILRDAGLISRYIDLHDFWLLRPNLQTEIIERTFPEDQFLKIHFDQPTNEFDFRFFPLRTGDFVYLYAGKNGTFEHMFTVTRVDDQGRAYTVTNVHTDEGYLISEVVLYDPNETGKGQIYWWTDRRNLMLGITGFGGFDIWRFSAPVIDPTPEQQALAEQIDQVLTDAGGDWHLMIQSLYGDTIYSRRANYKVHVASVIKIPIALLFFKSLDYQGIPPEDYQEYLSMHGVSRTFMQLLNAMLVTSEEPATETLLEYIQQSGLNIEKTLSEWGSTHIDVNSRKAYPEDIALLLRGLYQGGLIAREGRNIILNLMSTYTPNDETRLGVLSNLLPPGGNLYDKRGTITEEQLVVGDTAIVTWPGENGEEGYVLVIFGYPGGKPTTDVKLVWAIEEIAQLFWNFTSQVQ